MADFIDSQHDMGNAAHDQVCGPCFASAGLSLKVSGYCEDCVQFLCNGCLDAHETDQATLNHVILRGGEIPDSLLHKASTRHKAGNNINRPYASLSQIKATEHGTYKVKQPETRTICDITGIAVTVDGNILLADQNNDMVTLFSKDMTFLSSVSVPGRVWDIAVVNDTEALATVYCSIVLLGISSSQLHIKSVSPVTYDLLGISKYNDKFIVTCSEFNPGAVKLIDRTGKVYWSISEDPEKQPLFNNPLNVGILSNGRSSTVIVTDLGSQMLTLLNGDTGQIINRRQVQGRDPRGVTIDSDNNVYVCYTCTHEVAVLSEDLSGERILLSMENGLNRLPQGIVYDETANQLIISYSCYNSVDIFKLQ